MSDCKCTPPCSPCNNNCPDDGEILSVEILDAEDCNTNCCGKKCNDNCGINIQSTNDCLTVDTSECGVVKLTAECPKPTYVKAGDNVTVTEVNPPSDCYSDGGECGIKGGWKVSSTDEKVKACSGDTTPGYLNQKIIAGDRIHIESVGCNGGNAHLVISADDCPEYDYPELEIQGTSQLINLGVGGAKGHTIYISDKAKETYYNMVCLGFKENKDRKITLVNSNASKIEWIDIAAGDGGRDMYTGNGEMATHNGVKILESGYYRVFGQLTVENGPNDLLNEKYGDQANEHYLINLGRGFLRIIRNNEEIYLSTAKHGAYSRQTLLIGGRGISVSDKGEIAFTGGSFYGSGTAPEGGGTVTISGSITPAAGGGTQSNNGFNGPWATFNIDAYVDLYKNDIISLGYRGQSDVAGTGETYVRLTGANDTTTEFKRIFGGSMLGVNLVASHLFQSSETANEKLYGDIYQ